MKKIIRLTENELIKVVKKIINEQVPALWNCFPLRFVLLKNQFDYQPPSEPKEPIYHIP